MRLVALRRGIGELIDVGDDVFAAVFALARGRKSDIETRREFFAVYTFRDGLMGRAQVFSDRHRLLEAAGLSDQPRNGIGDPLPGAGES